MSELQDPNAQAALTGSQRLEVRAGDGTVLVAHVFPNPRASRRLVLSHGNGMATPGYRVFWRELQADFELVVFDMRGHGASQPGPAALHAWDQFVLDLEVLCDILRQDDTRPLVGGFHSLSAVTSLLHLRTCAVPPWQSLVLFDPPLTPPEGHPLARQHQEEMASLAASALRRPRRHASVQDKARQFMREEIFGRWAEGAAMDMARATLVPDAQASWRLACDPAREAAIFDSNHHPLAWEALENPACPIALVSGDPQLPQARCPALTSRLTHERIGLPWHPVTGTGHFLQLESPRECASALMRFVPGFH